MRISVDAHAIGRHLTGNEVYVRNLLHGFAALDQTSQFIAYISTNEAASQLPSGVLFREVSANPFVRLGYDLSRRLRADSPDLVHVQYTAPLGCPVSVVVSVHDVSFIERPDFLPPARARQLRITVERTVRRAARILTPSEFSRQSILRAYRLPDSSVTVVPNAVSSEFRPRSREHAAAWVNRRFGIAAPFILTVGDLQRRKNQIGLIRAFEEIVRRHPRLPHRLVIVGKPGWKGEEVQRAGEKSPCAERIHFTGFVNDDELQWLYAACHLFVFPSFYEGFGLPILEAMASGRAVACSNATAIPEVADSCALLFDPGSVKDMTQTIGDLLLDAEMLARFERLGVHRAAAFTWRNAAQRTLDVYREVAAEKSPVESYKVKSVPAI